MPRLVRRQTFTERVFSLLNPLDWLLYVYTCFEGYDWDSVQSTTSTPLGLVLNILLFISRTNCSYRGGSAVYDDILQPIGGSLSYGSSGGRFGYFVCTGDPYSPSSSSHTAAAAAAACAPIVAMNNHHHHHHHHYHRHQSSGSYDYDHYYYYDGSLYTWIAKQLWLVSWILAGISCLNAAICFTRKKKYRMFESDIDVEPSTPSAKRVRVDSSPSNFLSSILRTPTAESRAHQNQSTDVWEISVWDPPQICLRLFALFSPAHVALYFLIFPITRTPNVIISTTSSYVTVIILQVLLSIQLLALQNYFTRQTKDRAIINKEVFKEYDIKFVHPRLNTVKRDVATQCADEHYEASVDVYTPDYHRVGFKTMANPAYAAYTSATSGYNGSGTPPSVFQHHRPGIIVPSEYSTPIPFDRRKAGRLFTSASKTDAFSSPGDPFGPSIVKQEPESDDEGVGGIHSRLAFPIRNPSPVRRTVSGKNRGVNGTTSSSTFTSRSTRPLSRGRRDDDDDDDDDDFQHYKERTPRSSSRPDSSSQLRSGNVGTASGNYPRYPGAGTGVIGMVNMSLENSRSLTPVKMGSPIRKGGRARGSSYMASLGGGLFGTPRR